MNSMPNILRPRVRLPGLKRACEVAQGDGCLVMNNGPFRITVPTVRPFVAEDLTGLYNEEGTTSSLATTLGSLTGLDIDRAEELVVDLIRSGVVVEHPKADRSEFDGAYVGYRLVDTFRVRLDEQLRGNELLTMLQNRPYTELAVGFLLETYFVIRAANWTAPAVLGHAMTPRQRASLEDFFFEERDHAELMADAFATVGIDPADLRRSYAAPESCYYTYLFYAFGHMSVAHFATAIIMPEVPQLPNVNSQARCVLSMMEQQHGIPRQLLDCFRTHSDVDLDADHGLLPVQLLAEEHSINAPTVEHLFDVLRLITAGYVSHLDGIVRRYRGDGQRLWSAPIGEY